MLITPAVGDVWGYNYGAAIIMIRESGALG